MSAPRPTKSLEAWLRGYILFRVNGRYFLRYSAAHRERELRAGDVTLSGLHVLKGWRCFFIRISFASDPSASAEL